MEEVPDSSGVAVKAEVDISGCATAQLAAFFHSNKPVGMESRDWAKTYLPDWADRGDDGRDFAKIIDQQKYAFTGLRIVDKIVTALGFNLNTLTETGVLTIIPSNVKGSAVKMVKEEIAVSLEEEVWMLSDEEVTARVEQQMALIGPEEIEARVLRLKNLRTQICAESAAQRAILERDKERIAEARLREAEEEEQEELVA